MAEGDSQEREVDLEADPVSVERGPEVMRLFEESARPLPRSFHWLYMRSEGAVRAYLPTLLDDLREEGRLESNGDCTWTAVAEAPASGRPPESGDEGARSVADYPWEASLAQALDAAGLHFERRRRECGYELAFARRQFETRLNVEIGRMLALPSDREREIARDARLRANGWQVLRLGVGEVLASPQDCCRRICNCWDKLRKGEFE